MVARCISGDRKAWDEFVGTYKGLVYSAIIRTFRLVGYRDSGQIMDDLFQDVFALLLRDDCAKLRSFRWENNCSVASWINIITKNLTFDYIRKFFTRKQIMDVLLVDPSAKEGIFKDKDISDVDFLKDLENKDKAELFKCAVKELLNEELNLLNLVYVREIPLNKIAKLLGKSADAVFAQKKRLIKRLQKIIRGIS